MQSDALHRLVVTAKTFAPHLYFAWKHYVHDR